MFVDIAPFVDYATCQVVHTLTLHDEREDVFHCVTKANEIRYKLSDKAERVGDKGGWEERIDSSNTESLSRVWDPADDFCCWI